MYSKLLFDMALVCFHPRNNGNLHPQTTRKCLQQNLGTNHNFYKVLTKQDEPNISQQTCDSSYFVKGITFLITKTLKSKNTI